MNPIPWVLADSEGIGELLRHLLPYLIVILFGGLGLAKKVFESYLERERKRAKNEGRPAKSPFSSLRDFLESLEHQGKPVAKRDPQPRSGPVWQRGEVEQPTPPWDADSGPVSPRTVDDAPPPVQASRSVTVGSGGRRPGSVDSRIRRRKRQVEPARGAALAPDPHYVTRHRLNRTRLLLEGPDALRHMVLFSEIFGPCLAQRDAGSLCPGWTPSGSGTVPSARRDRANADTGSSESEPPDGPSQAQDEPREG